MKLFQCFVIVSLSISVLSYPRPFMIDENTTDAFSSALASLFEKFSIRNTPLIYARFQYGASIQQEDIFDRMIEKNRGRFTMQILQPSELSNAIAVVGNQPTLAVTFCLLQLSIAYIQPLLYYCPEMTIEELHKKIEQLSIIPAQQYPGGRNVKLLLKGKDNYIDLWSIIHFTADQSKCRRPQLVRTNRFLINEKRWQSNEFLTEPQRNFHGCVLKVTITYRPPFHYFYENENGLLVAGGINIFIVELAAQVLNFSIDYNAVGSRFNHKYNERVPLTDDLSFYEHFVDTKRSSDYIFYNNHIFVIPPGELYWDADKLLMPLELEVWVASIVTIVIALFVIQIINRLSKKVQNFVYGRNITTPSLNIMIAFVGGAQSPLPRRNFARFLLMLFIFFSLIIRTCYQSKLFTYLQADIVKHKIESIDELIDENGVIFVPNDFRPFATYQRFEKVVIYNAQEYQKFIEKTLDNGFVGAVLTNDLILNQIKSRFITGETSLKILKQPESGEFIQFPTKKKIEDFYSEQINEIIGRLHNAGLIDYWRKRWFDIKNQPEEESKPIPLTMNHLKAGFVVSYAHFQ